MNITSTQHGDTTVLRLNGDLDTASSPVTGEALDAALDAGAGALLVNLSEVGFVSSAGLRVLLAAAKRLPQPLKVCGLNETVHEVFEISGFSTIFDVYAGEDEALNS